MKKIALLLALTTFNPGLALAAGNTATATGTANATVVAPLQITHTNGAAIGFGAFTAGTGGTITVTQAGARSATGDVSLLSGGTVAADGFTVSGAGNRAFNIATSASSTVSTGGATPATMALALSAPATGTLSAGGTFALRVGGTLTVAANQAAGSYTGTYTVTVTYQ